MKHLLEDYSFQADLFSAEIARKAEEYIENTSYEEWVADLMEGNHQLAVVAFMFKAEKAIMRIFWRNYLGPNHKAANMRLQNGAYEEFCTMVYSNLIDPSPETDSLRKKFKNPFISFDPTRVDPNLENPASALINRTLRYIKNWAVQLNKNAMKAGGEFSDVSLDQRVEILGDAAYGNASYNGVSEQEQDMIDDDVVDSFLEMASDERLDWHPRSNADATLRNMLIFMLKKPEYLKKKRELAKQIGVSINILNLRNGKSMMDKLETLMGEYDIGPSQLQTVLMSQDKDEIIRILKAK